jgi:hypothetical protein
LSNKSVPHSFSRALVGKAISHDLSLAIDEMDNSLDFSLALKQAPLFYLSKKEAIAILEEVSDSVCQWKDTAKKYGLSPSECMQMESAFRLYS